MRNFVEHQNTKSMHKFLTAIVLSLGLICPVVSLYANTSGDGDVTDILITEGNNQGGTPGYYAPALVPIQAAYYLPLSTIYVDFLFNLGSVTVEIENETTGAYTQFVVNATQGIHPFVISGTAGHWTITFVLSNGVAYYGEFDINS